MNNTKTRIIEFWFSFRHLQGSVQPGRLVKRLVLDRELHGKVSDEVKMAEVLAALPMKVETTLSRC